MRRKRLPPLHLALLCGGDSSEREVSLRSGAQVSAALKAAGHAVDTIDPAEVDLDAIDWRAFDACFLALHGGAGEDGRLQSWLDERGVAYTGSGPRASHRAMSKLAAKKIFARFKVPTPPHTRIEPDDDQGVIARKVARIGFPVVVKPDSQGSSLGVGVARQADDLVDCVAQARQFDAVVLAERFVQGRELTVAVLGRRALPVLEIVAQQAVFDYQSKYNSPTTEHRFNTGLSPMKTKEVRRVAVAAAAALGTAGLARVDLMLDESEQPWVLEVNTLPGLTARSLAPSAAAEAGMDLAALCEWMVADAIVRRARKSRRPAPVRQRRAA